MEVHLQHEGNIEDETCLLHETSSTCHIFSEIPVEILLHICSYLDGRFISDTLSCVCQRFYDILNDEYIWKSRIFRKFNKTLALYPALPVTDNEFDWKQASIEIECQENLWKKKEDCPIKYLLLRDIHFAAVDAIHLLNNGRVCVSAGRDRSIVVWDLSEIEQIVDIPPYQMKEKAHQGWIWNLASAEEKLYSCSWDTTIVSWSLASGIQQSGYFKCENAVLSIAIEGNCLAAGLYINKVILFDIRNDKEIMSYSHHRRSVLALAIDDKYIISASEDQTIAIWDRRAGKILKDKVKLQGKSKIPLNTEDLRKGFPMSISYKNNLLYVGGSNGQLHLLDPSHGQFECVETYDVGHSGKITSIEQGPNLSSLITSSTDGSIRVFTPTHEPELISHLQSCGGEVTGLAYQNNILAASSTNCAVELWIPSVS